MIAMTSLTLTHVSKSYPGQEGYAVDDLTLQIPSGAYLVLLGPSGCGKSTTLRMIAGLESPDAGVIQLDDRDITRVPAAQRDIAMVFQNYALYPQMTVRQNLGFGLKMRGQKRAAIAERVDAAATALAIDDLLDRRPSELSGGQRQRVALGRAIVRNPSAFLLDEPLSNLDSRLRHQTRRELADLHRRLETTMVHVTHDQVEAMTLGTHVAVMDRGVLQQCGTPSEIYETPANTFVAGFVGSPPMNLVEAKVAAERRVELVTDGDVPEGDRWRLPPSLTRVLPPQLQEGAAFWLGIRPERLRLKEAECAMGDIPISHCERLGHETLIHLRLPGASWVLRSAGDVPVSSAVSVFADPADFHFFAKADGKALSGVGRGDASASLLPVEAPSRPGGGGT